MTGFNHNIEVQQSPFKIWFIQTQMIIFFIIFFLNITDFWKKTENWFSLILKLIRGVFLTSNTACEM